MIVCQCMKITDHDIHSAIDWMRAADSKAIISPGKIYRALGKTADCGGCMPLFLDTMRSSANLEVPFELSNLRTTLISEERYERKSEGY
ncbi:(2Fe-2S)-binding protein [Halocynthiibacter sp. C4]|uniref:(2Fe-2S)-binding protein n=2 Tax=Halocynthiibacter sp. C4 TaxID=2992758 RepID=UPI00237ABAB7|nr:(2Fe-2S)-binding protein [Halocynthiibacter sp. C4]MDE0589000.1 (2Fe-2S)-binding protein [Halocynthiibacter sp. C4]